MEALTHLPQELNGRRKTLNNTGWMNTWIDDYTRKFIDFSKDQKVPVLDIGAAYGIATLAVLARGVAVIANDIEPKHLELLEQSIIDPNFKKNLTLKPGAFPQNFELKGQKVGAILASRVLHFLSGPELEEAAQKMYDLLVQGGHVFVIADSPYTKAWKKYIPIYEAKKEAGYLYPGIIDEPDAINSERAKNLPRTLHRLDPDVLTRVFTHAKFSIVECGFFNMKKYPDDMRLDGRECVALVAKKI